MDRFEYHISDEVAQGLRDKSPIVALESTVITHGLPRPVNLELALDMEKEVRGGGAIPATIAVLQGRVHIGLNDDTIELLALSDDVHKISVRDLAPAIAKGWNGGTTVAGTIFVAHKVGIRVFATGGIGGVHRQPPYDISADLSQLAVTPMVVVCAGAKAILDLPATLEYLETHSVPVVGYQTDDFPAFYASSSSFPVSVRVDSVETLNNIARIHWDLGQQSAVLVVQPPPVEDAIPNQLIDGFIQSALDEAESLGLRGQALTPFLLSRIGELTQGASLTVNISLLRKNARLAAEIAQYLE
jgi:pseudouridine-5'-phosphate glycosidase